MLLKGGSTVIIFKKFSRFPLWINLAILSLNKQKSQNLQSLIYWMYSRLMKETWVLKRTILKQSPFLHISKFKTKLPQYINQQIALIAFQNDTNLRSINRTFSIKPRKFILKNMFKNIFVRNWKLYNSDKLPLPKK